VTKSLQGATRKGANIEARDADSTLVGHSDSHHIVGTTREQLGTTTSAGGNTTNSRGRAPVVHYLPADQRELCIGAYEDYVIPQRWERIVSGGVA
jgi:hypothetical protein